LLLTDQLLVRLLAVSGVRVRSAKSPRHLLLNLSSLIFDLPRVAPPLIERKKRRDAEMHHEDATLGLMFASSFHYSDQSNTAIKLPIEIDILPLNDDATGGEKYMINRHTQYGARRSNRKNLSTSKCFHPEQTRGQWQ
jgi:hypothetical protein